jgi:hypothetical protein
LRDGELIEVSLLVDEFGNEDDEESNDDQLNDESASDESAADDVEQADE